MDNQQDWPTFRYHLRQIELCYSARPSLLLSSFQRVQAQTGTHIAYPIKLTRQHTYRPALKNP